MRLLNAETLRFSEFFDSDVPVYAILSHRWGPREISFKEVRNRTAPPGPALRKIERCCQLAVSKGLQWVWIDTCCIDKRSSAELSEAINSMYKWYQRSEVCFVHLSDFQLSPTELSKGEKESLYNYPPSGPALAQRYSESLWFTRGWTLQELLAPETVIFFDAEWNEIGTRVQLSWLISDITKIDARFFSRRQYQLGEASIATKMSFAAHRTTSREEDMAYCLLGLFDITMPLLYGEGAFRAFQRLQVEIIRQSSDESLFAWTSNEPASGMLAPSPSCFANSGDIAITNAYWELRGMFRRRFAMSNIGLEFPIPVDLPKHGVIPIYLNCCRAATGYAPTALCIQLRVEDDVAVRVRCQYLDPAEYPQRYEQCGTLALKAKMQNTRNLYVKQPDIVETEYNRILSQIEGGELHFAKLRFVASTKLSEGMAFMNPGPNPIAVECDGRFMEPGGGSSEEEENAKWHTYNALMETARDVVFSGEPRDKILCQDEEWTVSDIVPPLLRLIEASDSDSDVASLNRADPMFSPQRSPD
ncbi:MAG: hypothetical protein LQ337_007451 [Flavoplaca oasis]|nr:MAG: hypothetical protein LQ337_007451 [Flavoplaca oasis]